MHIDLSYSSLVRTLTALSLASIAACGGDTPPAAAPSDRAETHRDGRGDGHRKEHRGEDHAHEAALPGTVRDFHQVLSPLWHAEKGTERAAKACGQASAMQEKAAAVESGAAPEQADPAAWKTKAKELVTATQSLAAECAKEGRPEFETRFATVHTQFHKLTEGLRR